MCFTESNQQQVLCWSFTCQLSSQHTPAEHTLPSENDWSPLKWWKWLTKTLNWSNTVYSVSCDPCGQPFGPISKSVELCCDFISFTDIWKPILRFTVKVFQFLLWMLFHLLCLCLLNREQILHFCLTPEHTCRNYDITSSSVSIAVQCDADTWSLQVTNTSVMIIPLSECQDSRITHHLPQKTPPRPRETRRSDIYNTAVFTQH